MPRLNFARITIFSLLVSALILSACQTPAQPTPAPTLDTSAIQQAWQRSPHANTYDVGKGPNTFCARCHSPRNWDPMAKPDAPPNCVSCKFATDPAMRIAKSNPPVAQTDWKNIGCEICHKTENGVAVAQIAWLNTATGQSEPVANATALCEKCHTNTETIRHQRDLGTSAHKDFTCVRCHNPHSTTASCTAQGCHSSTPAPDKPIPGHDQAHAAVACIACHDAAGLKIGTDKGNWITLRTTELLGRATTAPFKSHNLQRQVDCAKCHASNNPWGLKPVVSGTQ